MTKDKHHDGPQPEKLNRKVYEQELEKLQVELCHLQDWVKATGARIILVFEGRDATGKGGIIKTIAERVSPRVFRVVALPAPSDREKDSNIHSTIHRPLSRCRRNHHFRPELVQPGRCRICDGVLHGEEHRRFLEICPQVEQWILDSGIKLIKIWLEVGIKEQERRFEARINDPLRQWKLNAMDLASFERWFDYSRARDMMLEATDTKHAPWHILHSDDKRRARLNGIAHILSLIPYKKVKHPKVKLGERSKRGEYDDSAALHGRHLIPERY